MQIERLRAWWAHRQGLDGTLQGADCADVLARTGWARSVGGSAPYLGLRARCGAGREEVDAAVAALVIHELPSARGCTYVLPAQDFALGLTVGAGVPEAELRSAEKHLGVTRDEVDELCAAVTGALGDSDVPLDPRKIKATTGDAVRSLGEAGKKRGLSSTLPLALGLLQARGAIRRVPVDGRLDQQRYGYVRWGLDSEDTSKIEDTGKLTPESARAELARRYFAWAGPASMAHFRWFSGVTAAAAKAATAGLDLVDVGDGLLLPAALQDDFAAYRTPKKPSYALVAGIDGMHLLHRDFASRLLDPADAARIAPDTKGRKTLGQLADSPSHMIVDRGRLVGLWEYDVDAGEIVWEAWVTPDAALRKAVTTTEAFVRDELGDARSFSLDSPSSRSPRIAELRARAQ
ncbi:DNA glycosylase AlkZ-like family protein [Streptomyces sp. NBC_01304]|uniref:DNA glycosylase AlkZ-like family protein n=1 Tax=Streptomyces sp. NBC_01304 TaxID=2903818 RepID=UPI002E15C17B|nr:winged helix DNA-binding domain-containing protein [Streptomyces sp. NBC_01304]